MFTEQLEKLFNEKRETYVRSVLSHRGFTLEDAEDVVQSAFTSALICHKDKPFDKDLETWFLVVLASRRKTHYTRYIKNQPYVAGIGEKEEEGDLACVDVYNLLKGHLNTKQARYLKLYLLGYDHKTIRGELGVDSKYYLRIRRTLIQKEEGGFLEELKTR